MPRAKRYYCKCREKFSRSGAVWTSDAWTDHKKGYSVRVSRNHTPRECVEVRVKMYETVKVLATERK